MQSRIGMMTGLADALHEDIHLVIIGKTARNLY
jgi:hypothetical protein